MHGNRQQKVLPHLRMWNGCHHTMVCGFSPALHCKDVKKYPPRNSLIPHCSSKQSAVILVSFVLKLIQQLDGMPEGRQISLNCLFAHNSLHFSRRKIQSSFPIPFPIVSALPGYLQGCQMSPQGKL